MHWPLIHADDLAVLYRLMLERGAPGTVFNGAAVAGLTVGTLACAIARRFGFLAPEMRIVSADALAAEKGEWARGYALDQRTSGEKAMRELGWRPVHVDPTTELAERP